MKLLKPLPYSSIPRIMLIVKGFDKGDIPGDLGVTFYFNTLSNHSFLTERDFRFIRAECIGKDTVLPFTEKIFLKSPAFNRGAIELNALKQKKRLKLVLTRDRSFLWEFYVCKEIKYNMLGAKQIPDELCWLMSNRDVGFFRGWQNK